MSYFENSWDHLNNSSTSRTWAELKEIRKRNLKIFHTSCSMIAFSKTRWHHMSENFDRICEEAAINMRYQPRALKFMFLRLFEDFAAYMLDDFDRKKRNLWKWIFSSTGDITTTQSIMHCMLSTIQYYIETQIKKKSSVWFRESLYIKATLIRRRTDTTSLW